ncbi:hypothetical protein HME7025_01189 [Aquirufa nivalisilvae]|uniref:Uncharacterized protein n=1 Tax=Aquirufa nivalisilvae TaxID=2516557 RepID=A0A2S2DUT9_9BACT|nr:hypothetical protein [Aquirufa nivalisilvae]AWL09052.1 hypothetical protein HME7025_01189 [Aquirufa nivalisilvae]
MPKPYTFPTLYDDLKTISISFLKKHNYLLPNQVQTGTVSWSRSGTKTGSISIRVNTKQDIPYLELDYKCNETPINYRVQLVSAPSNLGKGVVWYFVCPHTGKRCRKLYLADTYFYHRSAFRGCMYEKQTRSKSYRLMEKTFGSYFKSDDLYSKLYARNFKKTYAGKPTKKYLKIIETIQKVDNVELSAIDLLLK